jgi:ligand-binding sensor domain-containing protein
MTRRTTRVFFIILAYFSYAAVACAQEPAFQQYALLGKNQPVEVNALLRDKAGYVWVGTDKGLFRFDGIAMQRLTTDDSLSTDHVTAIAQDSLGRIWTGHENGTLSVITTDGISRFNPPEGSATERVSDILFDKDGVLWFATMNDGLYYFVEERLFRIDEDEGMPDMFVYDIMVDRKGTIWAGTDGGVVLINRKGKDVTLEVIDYSRNLADNIVRKIGEAENGEVWLGTEAAGIVRYDMANAASIPMLREATQLSNINDFSLIGDQVWIAGAASGLVAYSLKSGRLTTRSTLPILEGATKLMADVEGNVWIGCKTGLVRCLGNDIQYIEKPAESTDQNVQALAVDVNGDVWFSTNNRLYRRSTQYDGRVVVTRPLANTPYEAYKVISAWADHQGFVWCGFYGEGVIRIDSRPAAVTGTNRIKHLRHELRNGNVLNITGKGERVWLSTLGGATEIDVSEEQLKVINYGPAEGLEADYIYQTYIDSRNRIWFASDREGVEMKDESGFHQFRDGLASKAVYGFAEDTHGTLWANVQDEGLYKFDSHGFVHQKPLQEQNINCLAGFASEKFIAVHDRGIDLVSTDRSGSRHLDEAIGFNGRIPNLNAVATDGIGTFYFGTDHGVVLVADRAGFGASPHPQIRSLTVFGKEFSIRERQTFAYDENFITVNFLGFWYQDPHNLHFEHRLDNYDIDWIKTGDRNAVYSSLPPGDYTFRLRVSADGNFENAGETSTSFRIKPPFWRTAVFYLFSAICLAGLAYTFVKGRERRLRKEKLILETRVAERTAEIIRKNEEIQHQAEEIKAINESLEKRVLERTFELEKKNKALEEYAFINAHNLRSPVASILGLINLLAKVELDREGRVMLEHLRTSAERLDGVVRTITESIERSDEYQFDGGKGQDC